MNYPVQYVYVLFVLLVNIIKIWCLFRANAFLLKLSRVSMDLSMVVSCLVFISSQECVYQVN